ncbi:MAG: YHS domain-containing protein [Verrucomicrobiales bacterium]|jgi:YHS domain-containing protein
MKLIAKISSLAAGLALTAFTAVAEDTNTICPIMVEDEVDDEEFSEYEGKKVLFCCTSCKKSFDKNPKYIIKIALDSLPQFKGMEEELKLSEVKLLDQKFCPMYSDSIVTPDSPSIEYKGKTIYFFKKRAVDKWEKDPEGNFKKATEAGLLPQFDENKSKDEDK